MQATIKSELIEVRRSSSQMMHSKRCASAKAGRDR